MLFKWCVCLMDPRNMFDHIHVRLNLVLGSGLLKGHRALNELHILGVSNISTKLTLKNIRVNMSLKWTNTAK